MGSLAEFHDLPPSGTDLFKILKKGSPGRGKFVMACLAAGSHQNFSRVCVPGPPRFVGLILDFHSFASITAEAHRPLGELLDWRG